MEIWQAIILGAVQGFAEFLPISSSGHLILLQHWFGITEHTIFYSIVLHVGTLIPVIVVLWKEIIGLFRRPLNKLWCLVIATIPAGLVGIILSVVFDIDALFANHIWLLAITFMFTAGELIFAEYYSKKANLSNSINYKTGLIMGLGQAVGVFPGISRSGTTVSAGAIARVNKEDNANFTFIMSIPIILAALLMEGVDMVKAGSIGDIQVLPLLFGFITAMITGYIAIKFMLKIIRKANYKWFSLYLVGISIATVITAVI